MSAFKTWLNGLTSKTTAVDADELYLRDSVGAASNKMTWANIKATLKTYFDGLYLALTGGTVAGGTRTTSGSTLTITETLNNAGVTFPGALVVDVTDTASDAASLLANFKVGGVSKLSMSKTNVLTAGSSWTLEQSSGSLGIGCPNGGNGAYVYPQGGSVLNAYLNISNAYGLVLPPSKAFGWSSTADLSTPDTTITRDAANTLAQRNGTNAQTKRLYGTYTDASNYRRVVLAMTTAGVATLTPEGAGTGASGNVLHLSGLPTSNPGAGILWNDSGTVKVGT